MPLCGFRQRVGRCLLLLLVGGLGCAANAADIEVRQQNQDASSLETPRLLLRPGDVLANAALGVTRVSDANPASHLLISPQLGVQYGSVTPPNDLNFFASGLLGVTRGAVVFGLEPDRLSIGQAGQGLVIHGRGLETVQHLVLDPADDTSVVEFQVDPSGERIDAVVEVATSARPGLRRLRILDQSGNALPDDRADSTQILLTAPVPRIDSVTPNLLARGQGYLLEIRGTNLRGLPPAGVHGFSEQPQVRLTPTDGIELSSTPVSNDEGTLVTVSIAVGADATLVDRLVQVITESGTSSDLPTPANQLHVADGSLLGRGPFVSVPLGVDRPVAQAATLRFMASAPVGVTKGAAIVQMVPETVSPAETVRLRLIGTGLGGTTLISLSPDQGIEVDGSSIAVSDGEVSVDIHVAADAELLPRRVSALDSTGRLDAPRLLVIRDAPPQLHAMTPNYLLRDGTPQTIELQGEHLSQVNAANVLPGTDLVIEDLQIVSDGIARLSLRSTGSAALGPRLVRLESPAGNSGNVLLPSNTLFIVDRTDLLTPFVAPVLGVLRPAPESEERNALLSAPILGVVRGAFAHSVSPDLFSRGTSVHVTIAGIGLDLASEVSIVPPDGVVLRDIVHAPDGTSIEFEADVAVDAPTGTRRFLLATPEAQIPFAPASSAIVEIADNEATGPVAEPDIYAATTNGSLVVEAANGVLANDHDPQGGALFAVLRALPAHGTIVLSADGGFVYTPEQDFVGADRFEYSAGAATLVGAATSVTLNVDEASHAVDDNYSVNDNQTLVVAAGSGLLANDMIDPGQSVEVELDSAPALGDLVLGDYGGFQYVPAAHGGVDHFYYRLNTGGIRSLPARVTISVNDVNEPPVAAPDQFVVDTGHDLVVSQPGVLGNDSDPDGDPLVARVVSDPQMGALTLNANGSFRYSPLPDFVGTDSFVYEAVDPGGLSSQASVTVHVNDHLAPLPDAYSLNEGDILVVDAPGVLGNDSAIPVGVLRIAVTGQPAHGLVQMANDGSFVYRPSSPDYFGPDSFSYRLEDSSTNSYPVEVALTIRAVNDPPIANGDAYLTDENVALDIPAPGVLVNDSDIDGEVLVARLLGSPEHGEILLRADGSLSYVPEVNFRGVDSFTYEAVDASGEASQATVQVDVTQPPTATNDVYLGDVDSPIEILDPTLGLLANDHDAPENDELSVIPGTVPEHGTLVLNSDGTFRYDPDSGYMGIDTFTYQVTDGHSSSNFGNVTLAVGITSLPRANADAYSILEDETLVVAAESGVLINDTDADTPPEFLQAFLVDFDNHNLSVTLAPDGSFTARPRANFYGNTFFVYQIYDGTSVSNAAVVSISVGPVNDGVEAVDDAYGVLRNTVFDSGSKPVSFNDHYDSDYPVNFEIISLPQHGSADLNSQTGRLRYTPFQDFSGVDTFTYRIYQISTGIGDIATVTLRTNAPPVANPDAYTVTEDSVEEISPDPLTNDFDPDGDPIHYLRDSFDSQPGHYVTLHVDDLAAPLATTVTTRLHFYGVETLRYIVDDGTQSTNGYVSFTVLPVPDAPIAADDNYITPRNTALVVTTSTQAVLNNDFDPDTRPYPHAAPWAAASGVDLLPIYAELAIPPAHGTIVFSPVGTFTYTPGTDYSGSDSFTYRAIDATGRQSEPATVQIRVNTPPVASADNYVVNEDIVLAVSTAEGVLANDTDIDGDSLQAYFASNGCAPCNGRVELRRDGGFRYTPNSNFFGQDEFFYTVRDGVAGNAVGHVGITVLPVNDAPYTEPDTYRTREDEVLVAPEPQGVLRNDREVDGELLINAELIEPPLRGQALLMPDGSFTYTPDPDANGRDQFRYRVFDESQLSSEDTVEILVTPVNDPPLAHADEYEIAQDQTLSVDAGSGVLSNDLDVDGPALTVALVGPPQHGQVDLQFDGAFVYVPDGIFAGVDQFQYQVDDGLGAISAAAVSVIVRPVAPAVVVTVEDDFYAFEGPSTTVAAPGVLGNDQVSGAASLSATLIVPPDTGTVTLDANGAFHYSAPEGFAGVTGFTYAASAGSVIELGRVTLDVRSTSNVPPVAVGEQFAVLEDHLLDSHSSGSLLANDHDFEGAPLSLVLDSAPEHGTFGWQTDGHFTYLPAENFNGSDRILYRVSDGERLSEIATASIAVFAQNDPPGASPDLYHAVRDQTLVIDALNGLLANDTDVDGDTLGVELVDAPAHGQVQVSVDGGFSYQPAPAFTGEDRFRYAATDGATRDVAQVTLTVGSGQNHPPVATGESYSIEEDGVLDSDNVGGLTENDTDPDGDALFVALREAPTHGTLELEGSHFRYRPDPDYFGPDAFDYAVSDGDQSSEPVSASIDVQAVNDAPQAQTDRYLVERNGSLQVVAAEGVLANDSDVEGQALTVELDAGTSHGALDLHADGSLTYVPDAEFTGRDEFAYRVSDGEESALGRAIIDVASSGNQRPVAVGEAYAIAEDSVLDTRQLESLLANDVDPEGQPLSLVVLQSPPTGMLEVLPGGHVRFVPERNAVGDVSIPYAVSDGELESLPVEVRITLLPVDDPPQALPDYYEVPESATELVVEAGSGLLANDIEPDGETLVPSLVRAPEHGQLNLGLDGSFVYTLTTTRPLQDSFRYRIADPGNLSDEAEVELDFVGAPVVDTLFKNGFESQ